MWDVLQGAAIGWFARGAYDRDGQRGPGLASGSGCGCGCIGCMGVMLIVVLIGWLMSCSAQALHHEPSSGGSAASEQAVSPDAEAEPSDTQAEPLARYIEASYTGDPVEPGDVLDEDSPIVVTCHEPDGSSRVVEGWTVDVPVTVEAFEHQVLVICYDGLTYEMGIYVETVDPTAFNFSTLDSSYELIAIDEYRDDALEPSGRMVRATFTVSRKDDAEGDSVRLVCGSSSNPTAVVFVGASLAEDVDVFDEVTFYGTVRQRRAIEGVGDQTCCYEADYLCVNEAG